MRIWANLISLWRDGRTLGQKKRYIREHSPILYMYLYKYEEVKKKGVEWCPSGDNRWFPKAPEQNEALKNSNKTLKFLRDRSGFTEGSIGVLYCNSAIEINNKALAKAEWKA